MPPQAQILVESGLNIRTSWSVITQRSVRTSDYSGLHYCESHIYVRTYVLVIFDTCAHVHTCTYVLYLLCALRTFYEIFLHLIRTYQGSTVCMLMASHCANMQLLFKLHRYNTLSDCSSMCHSMKYYTQVHTHCNALPQLTLICFSHITTEVSRTCITPACRLGYEETSDSISREGRGRTTCF